MIERDRHQQIRSGRVLTDFHVNVISGAISGVFVSILVSPLDVVRIRIQVKRLPKGVPDTSLYIVMYRLCKQEGIRAFYKGLGATMLVGKLDLSARFSMIEVLGLCTDLGCLFYSISMVSKTVCLSI